MAWVYILRGESGQYYIGSTDNLERRTREHQRGNNHTTNRFGRSIAVVGKAEFPSIEEARAFEMRLKKKKNPRLAIFALPILRNAIKAAPKAFGVGSGFESRPTQSS
jgi:predicted GIY-YIG superfamily endonuclease